MVRRIVSAVSGIQLSLKPAEPPYKVYAQFVVWNKCPNLLNIIRFIIRKQQVLNTGCTSVKMKIVNANICSLTIGKKIDRLCIS